MPRPGLHLSLNVLCYHNQLEFQYFIYFFHKLGKEPFTSFLEICFQECGKHNGELDLSAK